MGAVDDEHELQIDMLLRPNRCDSTREFGGSVCLREHDDRNLVLGFTASALPRLGPHLLGGCAACNRWHGSIHQKMLGDLRTVRNDHG
jgi:hypothetical protein